MRWRLACRLVLALVLVPAPGFALLPNPWSAVGRLDISGKRFCTGTVIGEREVLTAAHCLFEPGSQSLVALNHLVFLVGLHDGEAIRRLTPRAARFRAGYVPSTANDLKTLERDLVVLEFAEPLGVRPLPLDGEARWPKMLSTARYGHTRPDRVTVDHGCTIGVRLGRLWQMTCLGEQGNSGAPLLVPSERGPKVAGVIVAVRTDARRSWMLAVPLAGGRALPPRVHAARPD